MNGQGWEMTYGGLNHEEGQSVKQTNDGGYIIVGITDASSPSRDVWLLKTNELGDTLWTKTYGGNGYDLAFSVQQTTDSGYIICGWTESYSSGNHEDIWLVKTDYNGDTLWTNTYGGIYEDWGLEVQESMEGGYIIVGTSMDNTNNVLLIKVNEFGNEQWTKSYDGGNSDYGYSVKQTTDGGYIITGITYPFGAIKPDVWLIKTDNIGDTLWTKTFGDSGADIGLCVQQTIDGGYILTGCTYSYGNGDFDVWLIKTDNIGNQQWSKTYGGLNSDKGYEVQQTIDGGFIITGYTESFGNGQLFNSDVWLIRTDNIGDTLWTKTFGDLGMDRGFGLDQTIDSCYVITGITSVSGNNQLYLIKTDDNGNITSTFNIPTPNPNRKIESIVDILGRETKPKSNTPFIEIYDDGTVEKRIVIE